MENYFSKKINILTLLILTFAYSPNSSALTFNYFADSTASDWTVAGSFILDDAFLPATGNASVGGYITAWDLTWTDGITTSTTNSTLEGLARSTLNVNFDTYEVFDWNICTGTCSVFDIPEIVITSSGPGVDFTIGNTSAIYTNMYSFSSWTQDWSVADVSAVPVPAAAWLFGSALLGFFGFSRRKAKV